MSDFEEIKRTAQTIALGFIVDLLLAAHLKRAPDPSKAADDFNELLQTTAELMTFDHLDPAQSDLLAQELQDSYARHLARARALATGEPLRPETPLDR